MKIICPKCGIIHDENFAPCDATISTSSPEQARSDENPPADQALVAQPEWRREVAQRLESYRARRRKYRPLDARDDAQPQLGLEAGNGADERVGDDLDGNCHSSGNGLTTGVRRYPPEEEELDEYARRRAALRVAARPRRTERVEITVLQPEFDFSSSDGQTAHPHDERLPVAELRERRRAALLDIFFLCLTWGGFFLLFGELGGAFPLTRYGAAVCTAAAYLVYAQYFVLFTTFAGATPGMMLRGLEVVGFDGREPSARQLCWRSFGYLLSAAAVLLGFLWSAWDDDRLTWHDRISQTYITLAAEIRSEELVVSPQES